MLFLKVRYRLTAASSLAAKATATNQLCYLDNNVIASKLIQGPISLHHPEFHDICNKLCIIRRKQFSTLIIISVGEATLKL